MDSVSAQKATSLMKRRICPYPKNGPGARTPKPPSQGVMDSNSEDNDAKDTGATTPCGLPATIDLASAQKATSLMKRRIRPYPKMDLDQEHQDHQVKS